MNPYIPSGRKDCIWLLLVLYGAFSNFSLHQLLVKIISIDDKTTLPSKPLSTTTNAIAANLLQDETDNDASTVDGTVTIWSYVPLKTINPILVTTIDPLTKLSDLQRNVQFRVCSPYMKSKTPKLTNSTTINDKNRKKYRRKNVSPCPVPLLGILPERQDKSVSNKAKLHDYDNVMESQWSYITLYVNNTNVDDSIVSTKSSNVGFGLRAERIARISYWSSDLQEHVAMNKGLRIGIRNCYDPSCPKTCMTDDSTVPKWAIKSFQAQNDESTTNGTVQQYISKSDAGIKGLDSGRLQWDPKDRLCKRIAQPGLRPPFQRFGGPCSCASTCFTPEVNDLNSSWPWSNKAEREYFFPSTTNLNLTMKQERSVEEEKCNIQRKAHAFKERFLCPNTNTNKTTRTNRNETTSISSFTVTNMNNLSSSSSSLPCPIHMSFNHHLFFIPKAKLIFCGIPKVGITEWIKFFRFTYGAKDYLSLPHYKKDREEFYVSRLSLQKAEELLLNDPSWTKAVFFRNPAERLLSAYLNKIECNKRPYKMFGNFSGFSDHDYNFNRTSMSSNADKMAYNCSNRMSFGEFVELVTFEHKTGEPCDNGDRRGLNWCTDPHWKPQIMTCGLDALLPHFDFIGNIDYSSEHTKLLLERVGLWESYGKVYNYGDLQTQLKTSKSCNIKPPPPLSSLNLVHNNSRSSIDHTGSAYNDIKNISDRTNVAGNVYGFNQRGPSETYRHATSAKKLMQKYYTPELLLKVQKAYALDYAVWNDVKDRSSNDIMSGSELSFVQTFCSKRRSSGGGGG